VSGGVGGVWDRVGEVVSAKMSCGRLEGGGCCLLKEAGKCCGCVLTHRQRH